MKTYLELSQDSGSAHKFYEVIVDGVTLKIRYGRIGTNGQSSSKDFPNAEAAIKEANKKIKAKNRKGYEEAVQGVRKKRAITRRAITSTRSSAKNAPVLWKFKTGRSAFGIYVSDEACWVGNEAGQIYSLDHQGQLNTQYQLPDGVKCIIADNDWIYVGCDDGNVYDLTGKLPRQAYEINANVDIYWLDINNGLLGVSDRTGNVNIINYEDEQQWSQKSNGSSGWMIRLDEVGKVYHGHSGGVTCYYGWDGSVLWEKSTSGSVLFGWKTAELVVAGTARKEVLAYNNDGELQLTMKADASVFSCAASDDGKYFFAGDNQSSVYCFDHTGKRLWKLATTCGSAYSMQYHQEKVYIVTTDGSMACIDASAAAIEGAQAGEVPEVVDIKAPKPTTVAQTDQLETAPADSTGVRVHCIKEGGKLRIRVLSDGYESGWNVQFPKNLRVEGAEYQVDEIRVAGQGGFYRVFGNIYRV